MKESNVVPEAVKNMTPEEVYKILGDVYRMRVLQEQYFASRDKNVLYKSKNQESVVDAEIKPIFEPILFF